MSHLNHEKFQTLLKQLAAYQSRLQSVETDLGLLESLYTFTQNAHSLLEFNSVIEQSSNISSLFIENSPFDLKSREEFGRLLSHKTDEKTIESLLSYLDSISPKMKSTIVRSSQPASVIYSKKRGRPSSFMTENMPRRAPWSESDIQILLTILSKQSTFCGQDYITLSKTQFKSMRTPLEIRSKLHQMMSDSYLGIVTEDVSVMDEETENSDKIGDFYPNHNGCSEIDPLLRTIPEESDKNQDD